MCQAKHPYAEHATSARPYQVIKKTFDEFVKYDDHVASDGDKETLRKAFASLPKVVDRATLLLLIDVWMYYDPTDFSTADLVEPVFSRNKKQAVAAIDYRMAHRKKWETKDSFRDLLSLRDRLK